MKFVSPYLDILKLFTKSKSPDHKRMVFSRWVSPKRDLYPEGAQEFLLLVEPRHGILLLM